VSPGNLNVIAGYIISGSVSYQARTAKSGIGVNCFGQNSPFAPAVTDKNGNFSVTTRKLGNFTCNYFGNISSVSPTSHIDLYPEERLNFHLETQSYTLLPVVLKGGNLERVNTGG